MSSHKYEKIFNYNTKIKNNNKYFKQNIPINIDYLIIGCGISGIACALVLLKKQKSFVIFEKSKCIGGVWNNALSTSELQTDRLYYKFKDYEYNHNIPRFPNKSQILEYLNSIIIKSKLNDYIYFEIKTLNYKKYINNNQHKWEVIFKSEDNNAKIIKCNNLIFCTGKNTIPYIPLNIKPYIDNKKNLLNKSNDNMKHNKLDIIHSSEFSNYFTENKKNQIKKIIIVGNGASACDILKFIYNSKKQKTQNTNTNTEITMLYNSPKYFIKKQIMGISGSNMLSKRFLYFFENCNNATSQLLINLANIFVFKNYLDTPKEKIQSTNIVGSLIINTLLNQNNNNEFTYVRDKIKDLDIYNKTIILESGEGIITDIDLIILATGYSYSTIEYDFLYKYCIPIENNNIIQNCAYIGFNPKYNFIEECEKLMTFYLDFYEYIDKSNINLYNDINISNKVKKWYITNKNRKDKNNIDFLDCTYELFE